MLRRRDDMMGRALISVSGEPTRAIRSRRPFALRNSLQNLGGLVAQPKHPSVRTHILSAVAEVGPSATLSGGFCVDEFRLVVVEVKSSTDFESRVVWKPLVLM